MSQGRALLHATAVTKRYSRAGAVVDVVHDFDLTLTPGEVVAVTGPSLSGKTTTIELLAGWRQPDRGSILWNGGATAPPSWADLTVVPQGFALLEELTVVDNILLARRIARRREHPVDRLDELLTTLGLDRLRDRGAFEISVGERQRTMVARALVDDPKLILADEPVAHQDQRHADTVLQLFRESADTGSAVVVATRQPEIAALADRQVMLSTNRP